MNQKIIKRLMNQIEILELISQVIIKNKIILNIKEIIQKIMQNQLLKLILQELITKEKIYILQVLVIRLKIKKIYKIIKI